MEKLYSFSKEYHVTIYGKKYNRIYLPKNLWQNFCLHHGEQGYADIYIDADHIEIVPNENGEFRISNNGTSPNGRNVVLPWVAIKKYAIREGHYPSEITKNGAIKIRLTRIEDEV